MNKISSFIFKFILALIVSVLVYAVCVMVFKSLYTYFLQNKYPLNHRDLIEKYADEYKIEPSLVSAVIYEERRFRPESNSDKGAIGLMQLLPETADYIAKKIKDENFDKGKLNDVELNIKYGCYYLSYLHEKYNDWDKTLAAYNAGEGNVDKWIEEGDYQVKFEETRNFVERVQKTVTVYDVLYFEEK